MQTYLNETSAFTDKEESINNWHHAFRDFIDSGTQEANANLAVWLTADGKVSRNGVPYGLLHSTLPNVHLP